MPAYETAMARSDFQTVRTTAYTHTEADHVEYTNHNALGGELQAASAPITRAEYVPRALPAGGDERSDYQLASYSAGPQPFSMDEDQRATQSTSRRAARAEKVMKRGGSRRAVAVAKPLPPKIGSAAADWARWPAGTTFRLLSTGQLYRVDDYGWALSGRNTIDLYMATPGQMNTWGVRAEQIQILQWGDTEESRRVLQGRQGYKHIRRMLLEMDGREKEAAQLQ